MKIHLIISSLRSGGAERVVSILANSFVKNNHDISIITFSEGDKYELDKRIKRYQLHKNLPVFNYVLCRGFINLTTFYAKKNNRPDIICSHINRMGLVTIPIAKWYGIKIISSEHTNHTFEKKTLDKLFTWNVLYKMAETITVLTSYDLDFFKRKNSNTVVMPNPNSFTPIKKQNSHREKTIIAIGDLDRYDIKGFDNLIEIAAHLKNKFPDWKVKIVGDGNSGKKFLENLIHKNKLGNFVELLGYRDDIKDLLRQSAIFILTSRYEGLPMALMEATTQGTACISYDCISGPSDILTHNKNGFLIENQNKAKMLESLTKLMNDESLRLQLGSNAIAASSNFSTERIAEKWEKLFEEILFDHHSQLK